MALRLNTTVSMMDGGGGERAQGASNSSSEYTYDPKTGTWVQSAPSVGNSSTQPPLKEALPPSDSDSSTPTEVDSKTEAEKEFIEIEFRTLVGDLAVTPSTKSIKLRVNNTVEITGLGKYLSGLYYVSGIKRSISSSGYSQT